MVKFLNNRLWVGDFTRFEALAGGPFNHLNCQHTREFKQNFSKSQMPGGRLGEVGMGGFWCFITFNSITFNLILDPSAYASDCARKLWETLRRPSQNLAIWTAHCMLFYPTKTFVLFYIYFIEKFLAPSELELKKRSPWRIFRYTRLLTVVATEVHRSETWNLHTLDSW